MMQLEPVEAMPVWALRYPEYDPQRPLMKGRALSADGVEVHEVYLHPDASGSFCILAGIVRVRKDAS